MKYSQYRDKINALEKLFDSSSAGIEKVESTLALARGADPRLDRLINKVSKSLSNLRNLQEGDVVEFTAGNLPEVSEKDKKRKKALLLFIKFWKGLKDEVERIKAEIEKSQGKSSQEQVQSFAKIAAFAKGPFGIVTLIALVIAGVLVFAKGDRTKTQQVSSTTTSIASSSPLPSPSPSPRQSLQVSPSPAQKIKVITYNGKKIPLDMLVARTGPDCTNSPSEAAHYHAANGQYVIATDGTQINDPGACAFGKVEDVKIVEVELPS